MFENKMNNSEKILCFFTMASFYRFNIYLKMEKEFDCDFVFGPSNNGIKTFDCNKLKNFKQQVERIYIINKRFFFEKKVISYMRKRLYTTFIVSGDPYSLTTWRLLFLSKIYKTKIILWTHGYYGKENWLKKTFKKLMYRLSNHVFLYGDFAKQLMIKNNIAPESKLSVIYNSLNFDSQILERKKLVPESIYQEYFGNNNRNLIFIGRLVKRKNIDLLLNGLNILRNKGIHYNLTLIGEGNELNNLKILVDKLNLKQNIWFYGATFDESVLSKMIYNSDLCVSPGNVGLTAIHSMMYGTPVITHNNYKLQMPEFEAIDPLVTGAFFEYNNVQSMTHTITNWFEKGLDRNLIRQLCYKVVDEKYNPDFQINIMKSVLSRNQ